MNKTIRRKQSKHDDRGPISDKLAITMIDLQTKSETRLPVLERFRGMEVTEEMVRQQVVALNRNCGLHGRTAQPCKRITAFRIETLH